MQMQNALRWSYLNVLNRKRADVLTERFGSLDAAIEHVSPELLKELGLRDDYIINVLLRHEEFNIGAYASMLTKNNIQMLSIEDDLYPASLKNLPDPPIFLYIKGSLEVLDQPCIALVGSREMNDYGRRAVSELVAPLVAAGTVTVSGLAFGIDAEVAKETLHAGGRTVAVLGHGLGYIYPKANERLADDIVKKGGLLISEFPLDMQADKYTFPARNRIIAGLSLCTVVVQAAKESGSLITAELALEYGRDVCAVPGSIFDPQYAGCHELIARGHARLVTSAADILAEVGMVGPSSGATRTNFTADSPDEEAVYGSLSSLPAALDDLVVKAKLDAATVNAVLTVLEIKGAVKNVGGGTWVRA